jgi:hypothetical protein
MFNTRHARLFHWFAVTCGLGACVTVQRHGVDEGARPHVPPEPVPTARAPALPEIPAEPAVEPQPLTPSERNAPNPLPAAPPGASLLDPLHPELRQRALLLYQRAAERGIAFRFIHGFAPYKPRRTMGPGGMANWHNFGLAFDLNLVHRTSLSDAKAHFETDAELWRELGAIATELGLVWGGGWRSSYDPFHFEWHPGHDSVINRNDLQSFLKLAGKGAKRWRAVWRLFPGAENLPPEDIAPATEADSDDTATAKPANTTPKREKPPRKPKRPRRR